jgi:NADH-quinone oxidoreductase subunit C
MEQAEIAAQLVAHLGADRVRVQGEHCGQCYVTINPDALREALAFLRDTPAIAMNMLMDVGGVDYLGFGDDREWRFEVAYQLFSTDLNHRTRVKVAVADGRTTVPSVWDMWGVANWMEREVFDMFGITFTDHPNLRRILCHEDFKGHALRKDYPINKRQQLSRPVDNLLPEKAEWA